MDLVLVVDVETVVIGRNGDHVEKALKIGVPVNGAEQVFERNIMEHRNVVETVDEKTNVVVTGLDRRERTVLVTDLELV